jgi:non-ribosomal peptide synthetase component F
LSLPDRFKEDAAVTVEPSADYRAFLAARDFLLAAGEDYDCAYREFRWPELTEFNWALDHVDALATDAESAERPALWIVEAGGSQQRWSFAEMSARSNQVANWLRSIGVKRGDRLILMLSNQVELWEAILAAMKLGAVLIPATPLLAPADLRDRIGRGNARHVVVRAADTGKFDDVAGEYTRIAVGQPVAGWLHYADAYQAPAQFSPGAVTKASDTLLLYFTSGTTAKPPVHDVLDRAAAWRHSPQHLLAGVGQTRLVERVRTMEYRRNRLHLQLRPLRRRCTPGDLSQLRRGYRLRAANGMADAHPDRSQPDQGRFPGAGECW